MLKIIKVEIIGGFFPYSGGLRSQVVSYLKELVDRLERLRLLIMGADFRSYGSIYTSYIDVFCYKRDGSSTLIHNNEHWINGISIYLCKHAPVAVLGPNTNTKGIRNGSYGILDYSSVGSIPAGNWEETVMVIKYLMIYFILLGELMRRAGSTYGSTAR